MGMGDGEFTIELKEREPGATGTDETVFLIRPNAGLPFGPVAETASGGELSCVALAIAAVGGGETMVFERSMQASADDRPRRRRDAVAARRPHAGDHDHAPAADREPRRPVLPRREVAGDPTHTRIQEFDRDERKEELERMLGGRES